MKQAKTLLKEETEANICKWRISSGSSLTNKKPGKKSAFGDHLAYILRVYYLTEWPKKRMVSQNHKTHFIPVFIS